MPDAVGTAFGFAVKSPEPIPGLAGCEPAAASPTLRVTIGAAIPPPEPGNGTALLDRRAPDGSLVAAVRRDEDGGYRLYGAGFGSYDVAADASRIACHPPDGCDPWLWQRFLMSQGLPLAATLCGVEPFHASGVRRRRPGGRRGRAVRAPASPR